MKILIIGSGGREHALAWRLARSSAVKKLYATPGNPGIAQVATGVPSTDGSPQALLAIAQAVEADLTMVGPEAPLIGGVVDVFRSAGRAILGPASQAAQLEGSKIYAKRLFKRLGIPTAEFLAVENADDARNALGRFGFPVVLKVDGLAAGKGVIIAQNPADAEEALETLRGRLVIEEFLRGEEVSFIVLSDGRNIIPLLPTQDHKAVFDADRGPNTGGMGAYCDSLLLNEAQTSHILDAIVRPVIEATRFTGFLYAGLMMTAHGPKVLEFNVRLGDPETQPLMYTLKTDLAPVLMAAAQGDLKNWTLEWNPGSSVCVVLASGGYPGSYPTGFPITGVEDAQAMGTTVFHAGTRIGALGLETVGGRVLGVTASGEDLSSAINRAYAGVRKIYFEGMHYRTDIGRKGLKRYNVGVPAP